MCLNWMLLLTYVTQLSSVDLQAMPRRRQTGAEFLGASAKAAASSSTTRATHVNTTDFEEDDDPVTYVGRGGA